MPYQLLFDLKATQPITTVKRHGGGKYGEMVFRRLAERNISFCCVYDSANWLNPDIEAVCKEKSIPLFDIQKQSLSDIASTNGVKVYFSSMPGWENGQLADSIRQVGTLHGLRALELPYDSFFWKYKDSFKERVKMFISSLFYSKWIQFQRRKYIKTHLNQNNEVIMVSEHSRFAMNVWFPEFLDKKKVWTYYAPNTSSPKLKNRREGAPRYFLMVSGNRWDKNNLRALIAFDRLVDSKQMPAEVSVKITGCSAQNFKYKFKHPERFDFLGYVGDDELEQLYADAYCFVYPTLNEGFGYPPMEALRYHVPVIASPVSSVAELFEGGILYFNPFSIEEIANRMLIMLQKDRYDDFVQRGYNQYLKIKDRQDKDLDSLIDNLMDIN